jgi:two-component system, cell cycle sensor histidine kinase and response regulator CckA
MSLDGGMGSEPEEELVSLRREVQMLLQRVSELQRRTALHRDDEEAREQGGVKVGVSAREELLVEAERIAHMGSWVWDIPSNAVFWSDEMFRILGYDPERDNASAEAFFARVHPDDRERVRAMSEEAVAQGVVPQVDFRVLLPSGESRFLSMGGAMLFDAAGNLRRQVGTARDLTEERQLNQRLRRTLDLLEEAQTIGQLGSWVLVLDATTHQLEWSRGLYRLLGLDPSTPATLERFISLVHPEDREKLNASHERAMQGNLDGELDVRIVRASGEVRQLRMRTIAVKDRSGSSVELRGSILDITDQVLLSRQLAQVGKMDAVGRLASGIAHDFNNLLTVIGANLELWADEHGKEEEIQDARRAVHSAQALTARLLTFGRKAQLAKRVVDANELVRRTVELMRRVIGDRVRLKVDLKPDIPALCVDSALIEQAIINLIINARDAMPQGGTVTLRTRAVTGRDGGTDVEIECSDDGPGLDPAIKDHIFEPFFTTKGELGTGLGLPTVLGTVEQHGGSVEVDSTKGKGATFRLRLPAEAAPKKSSPGPEVRAVDALTRGREILVIEDEPLVAAVIARSLERKGHAVLLAHQADEAVRLWSSHPDVALVICDVSMGDMRGPELVQLLREGGGEVRVLYVTGYADDVWNETLGEPVLAKPFSPNELVGAVSKLLDRAAS